MRSPGWISSPEKEKRVKMSFHLRTTQAVLIRKAMVGAAFFLLSVFCLNMLADLKLFVFPTEIRFSLYAIAAFFSIAAALLLKPADRAAKHVLRDYVMRRECYSHLVLEELSEELLSVLNLRELANLVVNSFAEAFHLRTSALFVLRDRDDAFEAVSAYGWSASDLKKAKLSTHGLLGEILKKNGEHTLIRNILLKSVQWQDATSLEDEFRTIQGAWVLPFLFKGKLLGFLAFGAESPDRVFEQADFKSFRKFAGRVSIALNNALQVECLTQFNGELQDAQSQRFQVSKLKAVSQLAEGLAHEIHNPLAIISGKAQVLLFKKDAPEWGKQVEETLSVIIQQSKRAADIIRKVLASVRESHSAARDLEIRQCALEAAELLRYQAALKQIEVIVEGEEPVRLFANPGDMHEMFTGLMLNAVEMLGSHGWVRIQVQAVRDSDAVEILVTDSGPGVEQELVEQIFDPFFKTRHEALGLGLFTVKHIVHRYGGSIRAESRLGKGLMFQIHLPLKRPAEQVIIEAQSLNGLTETISERK
ncbi:MAG TPA: hypothetical protein DIS66_07635 [Candidatus Omnitrophica bacterium]|nr:hypothetical protein [Candidatus Omnitrophota bacterium]